MALPECIADNDCTNDKACINQRCENPCTASPNICGQNAECHPQLHRALCICRNGYTGNAQTACFESMYRQNHQHNSFLNPLFFAVGCRADSDCPSTQACINRECTDPCSFTQCGLNALCRADTNHKARCYCPDSFRGNPLVRCERPECTTDAECPLHLACQNERCESPCKCGPSAICDVRNHVAICSCPPGFVGNPLALCNRGICTTWKLKIKLTFVWF